jgi:segregation and condensation protein B
MSDLKTIVEALIFASPEPMSLKALTKVLEQEPKEDIEAAIAAVKVDYERPGGLQLVEVAGGYQIVTRPELHEWVRRLFHERTTSKLSVAALETLAVIAYRQPVTAPEIAEIRGVNTGGVLNTLVDRKLVKIVGRKAVVGRPFMYGTTREFLERFGLYDVTDLPKVEDMQELLGFDLPIGVNEVEPQTALPFENSEMSEMAEMPEMTEISASPAMDDMDAMAGMDSTTSDSSATSDISPAPHVSESKNDPNE